VGRLKNLLRGQVPQAGEDDLRGFEWHYWDHVTRGAPRTLRTNDPNPSVPAVIYSSDGKLLAALTASGRVHIWDIATGAEPRTFGKLNVPGGGVAISPAGRWFAVGGFPGRIYDLNTGDPVRDIAAGSAIAFSPDGERIALAADEYENGSVELRVVSAATGQI